MTSSTFDVVVVGAGTAGSNVAYQFARRGRSVLLLERRGADAAGAQWHNGVLDRHFVRAGLEPPSGAERAPTVDVVHLRGIGDPNVGPTLTSAPTVGADMGLLGRRLRKLAAEESATIADRATITDVAVHPTSGRITTVTFENEDGRSTTVAADLFVDASGRRGVLRDRSPDLAPWCPPLTRDELCSASDVHHSIDDVAGAQRFVERHGAQAGDSVTYVGLSGGFSTCAVTVARDFSSVGVVVGCLANGRFSTGPNMISELREREPWIGDFEHGGSGVIPLRRPYARITGAGIALVGDAACQVFSAHGSGIGIGLIAGTMLAEGVARSEDPGDPAVLWERYQAPFQHEFGGSLAGYDVLRRGTTVLGTDGVDAMVRSGAMDTYTAQAGLDQRWATPPPASMLRSALALVRHPRLARTLVPYLVRGQLLHAHGPKHPATLDLTALERWERRAERLMGRLPA